MNEKKYFPISTEDLKVNTILNFDIYIQQKNRFVLFREKNHPFTDETLCKLVEHKKSTIHILKDDREEYRKYYLSLQDKSGPCLQKDGFTLPIFDNPENVENYYKSVFNFYSIEKETLIPGTKVGFNVYKKRDFNVELYFGPENQDDNTGTIPEDIQESNFPVVIQNTDIPLYKKYLHDITQEYSRQITTSQELKTSIVRENSKLVIKEVFEDPGNEENVKKSSEAVKTLVETIMYIEENFYHLLKATSDDYYAYTHSLNVCTLSIGLGMTIGLKKEPDIMELGLGALLHDIGKAIISPGIINKPGTLTKEELKIVQSHVVKGKTLLEKNNKNISQNVFYPILQHHEKLSGNGYPYNLKESQIHLFGRITTITNLYDNLTTGRPYRKAYNPFDALELISERHEDYDQALLKEFITTLGNQKTS